MLAGRHFASEEYRSGFSGESVRRRSYQGEIAEQYQKAKTQPWRARIEAYSFLKAIGDVKHKRPNDGVTDN